MTVTREFLGWQRSLPEAAADWLVRTHGDDMADVLVAVPGRHALRRLEEHLARAASPMLRPPTVTTAGRLSDRLLRASRPVASRLQRTLAWARALADLEPAQQRALLARPPARADVDGWWELAVTARRLAGDLLAEGVGFDDVARRVQSLAPGEAPRWRALSAAHASYTRRLDDLDLADPHASRWAALEAGAFEAPRAIVLVGVPELRALERRLLARLATRTTALVFSPEELAARHDELGCVKVDGWSAAHVPLDTARWSVVERPADQAARAAELLQQWAAHDASAADAADSAATRAPTAPPLPRDVTLGVPDPEVVAYIERHVARLGGRTRLAEGSPLGRSAPARLLAATADWLAHRRFADLAALWRHPDLERVLDERARAATLLDAYHERHVPHVVPGRWRRPADETCEGDWLARRARDEARALDALSAALREALGELHVRAPRPLHAWAEPIGAWLGAIYGTRRLPRPGRGRPDDPRAELAGALARLRDLLDDLAETRDAAEVDAAAALRLLLRTADEADQRVAAPPDPDALALHGWLDLVHDDAPRLVLTGFNEGRVPDLDVADSFLPDGLRRALELPDTRARLARDVWALAALLGSRDAQLVTGKATRLGDPILPSRLAFHGDDDLVAARVTHLLSQRSAPPELPMDAPARGRRVPPLDPFVRPVERMSVTDFGAYLASPFAYHVERQLRLGATGDDARELDGRSLGNLAHAVLEDFGTGPLSSSTDADAIHAWLLDRLQHHRQLQYGDEATPAVALQVLQLGHRLKGFARWQARHTEQGWRIAHVEWGPQAGSVPLQVDGRDIALRGRIDRIDVHPELGCAIYDYKSGDNTKPPDKTHRNREGQWTDLQLPLYRELVRELRLPEPMRLGYVLFPRTLGEAGEHLGGWSDAELDEAVEQARDVVRAIERRDFTRAGPKAPWSDPSLLAMQRSRLVTEPRP